MEYNKRKEKIYVYIIVKYANCKKNHTTNFLQCILRYEIDIKAKEKKKTKRKNRKSKT